MICSARYPVGLLLALFAVNVAAFTTGRVTDATTGKPI
jgi:hypothetical protein